MTVRSYRHSRAVQWAIALLCGGAFVTVAPSVALAAGVVGTGTPASCTDAALNAALAGGGLVTFDCGGPATIDINTGTGTKTIAAVTTVDGGGLTTISGGNQVGVFVVNGGVNFTVENLTIANGSSANGGAILNLGNGSLTVKSSTFPSNGAGSGGAIFSSGPLMVNNSTFIGNHAGNGGAISAVGGATESENFMEIVANSTFTDNSAFFGGAILSERMTLTVTNSTFANNSAFADDGAKIPGSGGAGIGGAIAVNIGVSGPVPTGSLTVTNSTFTGNKAFGNEQTGNPGVGGAIAIGTLSPTPALLRNTMLASSPSVVNCVVGTITDGGHNLDDGTSCGFSTTSGSLSGTNPNLDPAGLRDNGGATETVALCTGVGTPAGCTAPSPASDAGDRAVCAAAPVNNRDQRGFVRPGTGHADCSMGAYEADATPPEACTGDCIGNGLVAINELILGVNIVLDLQPVDACPAFANAEGMVDIAQLIKGVNNALNGCGVG